VRKRAKHAWAANDAHLRSMEGLVPPAVLAYALRYSQHHHIMPPRTPAPPPACPPHTAKPRRPRRPRPRLDWDEPAISGMGYGCG
jgi:hypothetical protein